MFISENPVALIRLFQSHEKEWVKALHTHEKCSRMMALSKKQSADSAPNIYFLCDKGENKDQLSPSFEEGMEWRQAFTRESRFFSYTLVVLYCIKHLIKNTYIWGNRHSIFIYWGYVIKVRRQLSSRTAGAFRGLLGEYADKYHLGMYVGRKGAGMDNTGAFRGEDTDPDHTKGL